MRKASYPLRPVLFYVDVGLVRCKRVLCGLVHREADQHTTRAAAE